MNVKVSTQCWGETWNWKVLQNMPWCKLQFSIHSVTTLYQWESMRSIGSKIRGWGQGKRFKDNLKTIWSNALSTTTGQRQIWLEIMPLTLMRSTVNKGRKNAGRDASQRANLVPRDFSLAWEKSLGTRLVREQYRNCDKTFKTFFNGQKLHNVSSFKDDIIN